MSTKIIVVLLLIVGGVFAIAEDVPQRSWTWFKASDLATSIFSLSGSEEKLPGPLRAFLDGANNARLTEEGVVKYTNEQREKNGLVPLHSNKTLAKAAEAKVDDMFAQQYFEHESPDGKSPADVIKAAGYEYIIVGENLALGNFTNDEVLVQAWMDSPGHRANILHGKFYEIGVSVKKGMFEGKEVWLAVQEFGAPLSSCPSPSGGEKAEIEANRKQLTTWQAELQRKKSALETSRYGSEQEYNRAVAEYNALAEKINRLSDQTQDLVRSFNESVNEFNRCLESNS